MSLLPLVLSLNILSAHLCLKMRSENNIKDFAKGDKTPMEASGMTSVLLCVHMI